MLLQGEASSEIARVLEVSASTVQRWRNEPEVAAELAVLRAGQIEDVAQLMRRGVRRSVAFLVDCVGNDECETRDRIAAAKAILDRAGEYTGDVEQAPVRIEIAPSAAAELLRKDREARG